MKRRSFFSIFTGVLGVSFVSKLAGHGNYLNQDMQSVTLTYKYRNPEELRSLYGENASEKLERMRTHFFEQAKLLSLKKYVQSSTNGLNRSDLLIELVFDSVTSKAEFLEMRSNVLKNLKDFELNSFKNS
jgi:hypothetical protein